MVKRLSNRTDHLRSAVAQEAARLMAQHGIQDYLVAKRKAADRFGVSDESILPRNSEIESALASYQRLFGGAQHAGFLQQQRRLALRAMQLLRQFEPRLVGAVLNGSATEHSEIQLHVFSDTPEAVYLHLADRRFEYEVFERRLKIAPERLLVVPSVRFGMENEMVEAFVFPTDGIRQAPTSPINGRPMRRVGMNELSLLIETPAIANGIPGISDGR